MLRNSFLIRKLLVFALRFKVRIDPDRLKFTVICPLKQIREFESSQEGEGLGKRARIPRVDIARHSHCILDMSLHSCIEVLFVQLPNLLLL